MRDVILVDTNVVSELMRLIDSAYEGRIERGESAYKYGRMG